MTRNLYSRLLHPALNINIENKKKKKNGTQLKIRQAERQKVSYFSAQLVSAESREFYDMRQRKDRHWE